ncbi:hypothetical protein [Thiomicrospira cyclica]|uniref:Uncharacterized protein n=1 Tax=Thiomicrospira cyclica (strain DSM 14477 / JCM 11371 / ALM1) TaxID=717773 RepID=F6DBD3_THICA|nr:hypothetical protein [Thiomicrospira cyclica]AEG31241.1 hypothetical protein Thicy_0468 [Thiomicrospira cyclica ALM1]
MGGLKSMSVGFSAWQEPVLQSQFYPDDLPEDWRADYYFNNFRVAMAPQHDWMQWDQARLISLDEAMLAENFVYLNWSDVSAASVAKVQWIKGALGSKLAGLLLTGGWTADLYHEHHSIFNGLAVTLMQPLSASWVLSSWQWDYNEVCFSGEPLGMFDRLPANLKEQRQLIEAFRTTLPGTSAVPVFVNANQVSIKQLTDLSSMIELLGY